MGRLERAVQFFLALSVLGVMISKGVHAVALGLAILLALCDLAVNPASRLERARRWGAVPFRHWWYLLWAATAVSWAWTLYQLASAGQPWSAKVMTAISLDVAYVLFVVYFDFTSAGLRRLGPWALAVAGLSAAATIFFGRVTGGRLRPEFVHPWGVLGVDSVVRYNSAIAIVLLFALALWLRDRGWGRWPTLGALGALVAGVVCMTLGEVRTAFGTLALGSIMLFWRSRHRRLGVVLVVAALLAGPFVAAKFRPERLTEGVGILTAMLRPWLAEMARSPWWGQGLADRHVLEQQGVFLDAHNSVLNMALRRGLVATVGQVGVLVCSLLWLWRLWRATPDDDAMRPWVDGAVAATLVVIGVSVTQGAWFQPQFRVVGAWVMAFVAAHAGTRS